MLPAKKPIANVLRPRSFTKHLEYLYARRSAIDAVIQSLEAYQHRFRPKQVDPRRRKTA